MTGCHQRSQPIPLALLDRRHGIANALIFRDHVGGPLLQYALIF